MKIIEALSEFAEKVESYPTGYAQVRYYNFSSGKVEVPEDADERKYVYREDYYGVTLYGERQVDIDKEEDEVQKARREAEEKEEARKERILDLSRQAYELRKEFIKNFSPKGSHIGIIEKFLWDMVCFGGSSIYKSSIDELCDTTMNKCGSDEEVSVQASKYFEENPVKPMLITAYLLSGDDQFCKYVSWNGLQCENKKLDKLYENLERLGYQISDDEKKLQDGTHELFERGNV